MAWDCIIKLMLVVNHIQTLLTQPHPTALWHVLETWIKKKEKLHHEYAQLGGTCEVFLGLWDVTFVAQGHTSA